MKKHMKNYLARALWAVTACAVVACTVVACTDKAHADASGSGIVDKLFIQQGAGAVARPFAEKAKDAVSVKDFGALGDGVKDDTTAIQAAINAGAGRVSFPDGNYLVSAPITLRNGVIYEGAGVNLAGGAGGTKITYTGTTDAFKIANRVNSSTSANIRISGIYFYAASLTADQGVLFDTGSSVVLVSRCRFYSSGVGIILDQSELWDVEHNSFLMAGATSTGVWVVNGADKNVRSKPNYSNRLGFRSNEFNGAAGSVAIYDDGGVAHSFTDNNLNAAGSHIIATGVSGLTIQGGEYEGSSAQSIILGLTKRKGGAGAKSPAVRIAGTFLYNNINQPVLAMVAGAVGKVDFSGNVINTAYGNPLSGLAVGADEINAYGNSQVGVGVGGASINNQLDNITAHVDWKAATTAPVLGNGSNIGAYSRRGKQVTFRQKITFGSKTAAGAGSYKFPVPVPADTSQFAQSGTVYIVIPGSSFYTGTARLSADGLSVELFVTSTAAVGGAVPAAWTPNSSIEFQIQYSARDPI